MAIERKIRRNGHVLFVDNGRKQPIRNSKCTDHQPFEYGADTGTGNRRGIGNDLLYSFGSQTCQGGGASGQREGKEQPEKCDHRLCSDLRADCGAETWYGRNAELDEQRSRDSSVIMCESFGCRKAAAGGFSAEPEAEKPGDSEAGETG